MLAYNIALFIHFIGLISVFGGFVIVARAGSRLRAATDMEQVRSWSALLNTTGPMFGAGYGLLLLSGIYMAATRWRAPHPWLVVAMLSLVAIWIVGGVIVGRHVRAINAAAEATRGSISGELALQIANPSLWRTVGALNGLAMGVVFIMTVKPGWLVSLSVVLIAAAIGVLGGAASTRRAQRHAPVEPRAA
jgi:hypothetical protein